MRSIEWRGWLSVMALLGMMAMAAQAPLWAAEKKTGQGKVNINQASVEQLTTLPGIGPAIAKRIVEHRSKNGPFKKIEDLMSVKGMGEKKFAKIRDRLTL